MLRIFYLKCRKNRAKIKRESGGQTGGVKQNKVRNKRGKKADEGTNEKRQEKVQGEKREILRKRFAIKEDRKDMHRIKKIFYHLFKIIFRNLCFMSSFFFKKLFHELCFPCSSLYSN